MTEAIDYTADEKRAQDERINDALVAADFELQDLLDFIFGPEDEARDAAFGITLSLPSGVMGGIVVPRAEWSGRLNEALVGAGATKVAEARQQVEDDFEPKRKILRAARQAEGRPLPPRQFIHLKDAELRSGGQNFILENVRVDLSHVSAWSMGSWTARTPAA